jgi:hypothetical protein
MDANHPNFVDRHIRRCVVAMCRCFRGFTAAGERFWWRLRDPEPGPEVRGVLVVLVDDHWMTGGERDVAAQ